MMANDPIPKFPVSVAAIAFVGMCIFAFLKLQATHPEYPLFATFLVAGAVALTAASVAGFFTGAALYFLESVYKPR